jgi:hypothetical protein
MIPMLVHLLSYRNDKPRNVTIQRYLGERESMKAELQQLYLGKPVDDCTMFQYGNRCLF